MLFNTSVFLFLCIPLFFAFYFLSKPKYKNLIIVIFSIIFYAWGEPKFIFVVLLSSLLDYIFGDLIYNKPKIAKFALICSIILNIGVLFYFKYFNFFADNVNNFLSLFNFNTITFTKILLPLAISFITFEKITYTVDIYRKTQKPANTFLNYLTYILLFPKLIAGPIIKYHDISHQLENHKNTLDDVLIGFYRFSIGLAKKVFIADTMAVTVDYIFALPPNELGFLAAWFGALCFALQIYFDFSGYSDMAIGLMRILGFKIPENFNLPYISKSFSEFWKRWHISLSSWIKEYLYIPLGGNRLGKPRMYVNLLICFLLSGLWHGASWTFVLWGIYHGIFIILDKMFSYKAKTPVATFLLIIIGWVIFRSQNFAQIKYYFSSMFNLTKINLNNFNFMTSDIWILLIIGLLVSFIPKYLQKKQFSPIFLSSSAIFIFILAVSKISTTGYNSFIYFRF